MIEKVQDLTEKYVKRLENEPESPSSVLEESQLGRNDKFTTDIWHESTNLSLFKYQLGYLSTQLLQESKIFNDKMTSNLAQSWSSIFEKKEAVSC
jgi:hypothetical protein